MRRLLLTIPVLAMIAGLAFTPPEAHAASWPIVREGDRGQTVRTLQYLLRQHGISVGVDGNFGPQMAAGVKQFQSARRLTADGIVGPQTWQALIVTVRNGSRGEAVKAVQSRVGATPDGVFGPATEGAVKRFQASHGLAADGVVGPQTWQALVSGGGDTGGATLTHAQAVSLLRSAGITQIVSSGNCSDRNRPTCTSLDGVRRTTIDGLIAFRRASGCDLVVTGGTEVGHSTTGPYTHGNGHKIDVRRTSCVTTYIQRHYTRAGTRGDGAPLFTDPRGNIYADEYFKNHWDIAYK